MFDAGGSGYAIGRDAIIYCLKAEEQGKKDSILYNKIKAHYKTENLLDFLSALYEGGKKLIASSANAVFDAFNEGDKASAEILERNFESVAQLIVDASRDISDKNIRVCLVGSVAKNNGVASMIERHLEGISSDKKYNISVCTKQPVVGALRLAGFKEEINNA